MTLVDDCFAHDESLMNVRAAEAILKARITPVVAVETASLEEATGRILAESLIAVRSVPAFDNSAMDGYALAHASLSRTGETRLKLAGRVRAGHPLDIKIASGMAVRILTGAPMPEGTDTVVMQEDVKVEGDEVIVPPGLREGANRRFAGEDIAKGDTVLKAGRRLRPQDIGSAASMGYDRLKVLERLRVALFSTGDELVRPGSVLPPGGVYDSNRYMLAAMLRRMGHQVSDLGVFPDRHEIIRDAMAQAAATHHAVITSGGASKGDEDHVVSALAELGHVHFWRLAIKPGRPLAFGQIGNTIFAGLPGNPVSGALCLARLVRPMLNIMAGGDWLEPVPIHVPAGFSMIRKPGRREWLRVRLVTDANGSTRLEKYPEQGSGILTSLVWANGFAELPEDMAEVTEGTPLAYLPFSALGLAD